MLVLLTKPSNQGKYLPNIQGTCFQVLHITEAHDGTDPTRGAWWSLEEPKLDSAYQLPEPALQKVLQMSCWVTTALLNVTNYYIENGFSSVYFQTQALEKDKAASGASDRLKKTYLSRKRPK